MARVSGVYESSVESAPQLGSSPPERCILSTSSSLSTSSRFAPPKTDAEVASKRKEGEPKKTLEDKIVLESMGGKEKILPTDY